MLVHCQVNEQNWINIFTGFLSWISSFQLFLSPSPFNSFLKNYPAIKKKGVYAMLQTINRGREQHLNYRALPWRHIIKQTVVIVPITDCTLLQLINKWMDVYFVSTRSPSQIVSEKQSYYCKLLAKRSSLCRDSDTRHRLKAATDWWTQAGDQFLY